MDNSKKLVTAVALAAASLLSAGSAWAAPCVTASVTTYTAAGFTCDVDGLTFSNFGVNSNTNGSGAVTVGNITPFTWGDEFGLTLDYNALAFSPGDSADIAWTYNVAGSNIVDAFLALSGTATGSGHVEVNETLSNGVTLSLLAPGATTATFDPIDSLAVLKDQINFVGETPGTAAASLLTNAFSRTPGTPVPEPASLAILGAALTGMGLLGRRRRVSV